MMTAVADLAVEMGDMIHVIKTEPREPNVPPPLPIGCLSTIAKFRVSVLPQPKHARRHNLIRAPQVRNSR